MALLIEDDRPTRAGVDFLRRRGTPEFCTVEEMGQHFGAGGKVPQPPATVSTISASIATTDSTTSFEASRTFSTAASFVGARRQPRRRALP